MENPNSEPSKKLGKGQITHSRMPPAAGLVSQGEPKPTVVQPQPPMMTVAPDSLAKDAVIAWFRGEFAAANAIIDALCGHLIQLERDDASVYESAFAAIHRRRLNWIPILQMQKYYTIADVASELNKVAAKKREEGDVEGKKAGEAVTGGCAAAINEKEKNLESSVESHENCGSVAASEDHSRDDSPESEITDDTGSEEMQLLPEQVDICSNHEECESRRTQIKMTKGFVAKEPVKGHTVNVVRGLKLYEDIFSDEELFKLNEFVNELRIAGRNGELSGETFILYNQKVKGNKRELIQLGVPIFGRIKGDAADESQKSYIEPIPALLQSVTEHLTQWRLIRETEKPNSCIINFFDEGGHSQPFLKPPHLDQPLSTLLLSESTMAFGRTLMSDKEGNYKGPLTLSLKEGSLLVMRGNSSDTARHVMCSSGNKRVSITFFRVRTENACPPSAVTPYNKAMTLWQPGVPSPYSMPNNYELVNVIPKWGLLRPAMVMLPPVQPMIMSPRTAPRDGTGVFLPWTVGPRKPAKHLPPRAQRRSFLALPSPVDTIKAETDSDSGTNSP